MADDSGLKEYTLSGGKKVKIEFNEAAVASNVLRIKSLTLTILEVKNRNRELKNEISFSLS